jgi:hypothetical protein
METDVAAEVVAESPTKVFTAGAEDPHTSLESRILTTFELASPTPPSCNPHASVSVQLVLPVNGPEIWKEPTWKE